MQRSAQNVLEAERLAALATMPSDRLPKDDEGRFLYDPRERHQLFLRLDSWTTKQSGKDIPFDRAPALVLMMCRSYDDVPNIEMRNYIRNLSNVLGTARDAQLCIDIHEFYRIGDPAPHPETLMGLLSHQIGDAYPSYDTWSATFTEHQRTQWNKALAQARAGTLRPRPRKTESSTV